MHVGWRAQLTPREYLETALRPVAGSGRAVEAKNAVRGEGEGEGEGLSLTCVQALAMSRTCSAPRLRLWAAQKSWAALWRVMPGSRTD